ncbi:MAG: hypothetical protein ACRCXY_09480 [Fusobacteriaceae bacterium]
MKSKWLTLIMFSFVIMLTSESYSIDVTPASFTYNLTPVGLTQDVVFYNRKDMPERVKVSFKKYKDDSEEKNLGKWATVYPKIVTVGPDQQKVVKFSIEPPKDLERGEYRALLFMEELEQKALNNLEGKVVLKEGNTTQIKMLINLGIVVYGYVGDPTTFKVSGKVSDLNVKNNYLEFYLENDGEITKPYNLVFEGIDKKTKKITSKATVVAVVQGYKEKVVQKYPEDIEVSKIYLKDSNEKIIQTIK